MATVEYWDGDGVSPEALEAEVRRLAAEQPERIYDYTEFADSRRGSRCKYTHTLEDDSKVPGCIVGVAIHNITGKLVDADSWTGGVLEFGFMRAKARLDEGEYRVWSPTALFLANVQAHQDNRATWGSAVEIANNPADERNWYRG
jgi:hypothetical protein